MGAKPGSKGIITYKVITHLEEIGVKSYDLARPKPCQEIWTFIEPTFKQAGHKIVKKELLPGYKIDDVRGLRLTIALKERSN